MFNLDFAKCFVLFILLSQELFPLDGSDLTGISLICIGLMIAASGGIGGGGIVVPLLILVLGFQPKHAVALSNFTILGSSLMNMALNIPKRHPFAKRPLVDWDLILVMEPLTMIGAVREYLSILNTHSSLLTTPS